MIRCSVEACLSVIPDYFDLVVLASFRAREIDSGAPVCVPRAEREKSPVIALLEIAKRAVSVEKLREDVIKSYQTFVPLTEEEPL